MPRGREWMGREKRVLLQPHCHPAPLPAADIAQPLHSAAFVRSREYWEGGPGEHRCLARQAVQVAA